MKLIKPNFEILEQENGLDGVYKQIERVGRTCYKSEDRIAEGSAKPFVDRMIASKHLAMCEHGTIYLKYPMGGLMCSMENNHDYENNPYSRVHKVMEYIKETDLIGILYGYVTTNLRVLVENDWLDDLKYLCEPTEYHERRVAVKFVTDQGILREFTRHRVFSFACESTRYCNYCNDKFNNEITFIIPNWCKNIKEGSYEEKDLDFEIDTKYTTNEQILLNTLFRTEMAYLGLSVIWKPQQARNVLPLATKCDMIMTGFVDDWNHFFDLRARGTTGAPHPQAKELAEPLLTEFIKRGIVSL